MYTTNKIEVHQRKSHDSIIWDIHNAFTGHTLDVINNSSNTQHEESLRLGVAADYSVASNLGPLSLQVEK